VEDKMAELKSQVEQAANSFEKVIAEQTSRFETAVAEVAKLQSKGIAQANSYFEDLARVTREQIAFAEQLGGEWRKLVLASVKSASEIFAPKA
jgi:methyl-accepting chemotaxis protein